MTKLAEAMPIVSADQVKLADWGQKWLANRAAVVAEALAKHDAAEAKRLVKHNDKQEAARVKHDATQAKRVAKAAAKGQVYTPEAFEADPFETKPFDDSGLSGSFNRKESVNFAGMFDRAFGEALAQFLGGIPVVTPQSGSLLPPYPHAHCVEVGATRIVGGIRPQNYDAAYRPDGPRVVLDSKSLNDRKSIGKNWQNMINDLATEAATIHTRFPYAVVAFMVVLPRPALDPKQQADIVLTLERLGTREHILDQHHLAEAIALILWDPETGLLDEATPGPDSTIGLAHFSAKIARCYTDRYKGLPPHSFVADIPAEEDDEDDDTPP